MQYLYYKYSIIHRVLRYIKRIPVHSLSPSALYLSVCRAGTRSACSSLRDRPVLRKSSAVAAAAAAAHTVQYVKSQLQPCVLVCAATQTLHPPSCSL